MNTILKRVIALVLCFVMTVGYVPVSAFATEADETVTTETTEVTTEETGESSEESEAPSEAPALLAELSKKLEGYDKKVKEYAKKAEKAEKPGKPEKPAKPGEETVPVTEETVPETTEATVPATEETVPETTEETVPENQLLMTLELEDAADLMAAALVAAALEARSGVTVSNEALAEAQAYVDALTINNTSNDPATVVGNFGTHFTWDNEKRESSKTYLYDWSYYNGVVFEGLEYLYEVTGKTVYKDYVEEYMSSMINANGTWASCTNNSSKQAAGYDSTHGADCYKTASLLLDLYEMTNDSRYKTMAATLYADLDTAAKSYSLANAGNNYRHTWASDSNPDLWLDGLYMILPFRAEYAKHIGDTEELDLIVSRMKWVSDNMYNSTKGLFYHAADSATSNSGTYWLRSIGWYAAAIVDVMDSMSGDNLEAMKTQLKKLVDGMLLVQNSTNGMWLNNMDASKSSTNPYETSGTALVCYAVMKAVNNGWLDKSYADMAILAFNGICSEKLNGTTLKDICFKGAPGSSNSTFYDNEGKGVGPFIMFYAEVLEYTGVKPEQPEEPEEPEESTPTEPAEPEAVTREDADTGVSVTAPGITGLTVAKIEETTQVEQIQQKVAEVLKTENLVMLDISVADFVTGSTATVVIPIPEGMDSTKFGVYYVPAEGELELMPGKALSETQYEFTTTHFSTYVGGEITGNGVLENVTGVIQAQTEVTEIESGAYYQLMNIRAGQVLSNNTPANANNQLDTTGTLSHYWYITKVNDNANDKTYYVQYGGPDGDYLHIGNHTAWLDNNENPLTVEYVTTNGNNAWVIKQGDYRLNDYSGNAAGWSGGADTEEGNRWQLNRAASKTYVLDTDGMNSGESNKYVIVGDIEAKALTLSDNGTVGNADVILSNNDKNVTVIGGITDDKEFYSDYEFYFADNSSRENNTYLLTQDGTNTIRHNGGNMSYTTSNQGYWYVGSQNNGQYKVYDFDNSNWHLNYGYSFNNSVERFSVSNREETVRLYRPITAPTGGAVDFTVTPAYATIQPNETVTLNGTVIVGGTEVELSKCTITWASSDNTKVTVSSDGIVTGVADTTEAVNITATLSAVNGTALQENIVLTIPVTVATKAIDNIEWITSSGAVYQGDGPVVKTGGKIKVTYSDGTEDTVNVTVGMLNADTKTTGTKDYTLVYNNVPVEGSFKLTVLERPDANYPEYPDPGSVMVDKYINDYSQFQNTGVAEINLVTSGLPALSGVDVILVTDLSNSMARTLGGDEDDAVTDAANFNTTKLYMLQQSVASFANIFLDEEGAATSNTISLVTFGGYDKDYTDKIFEENNNPQATLADVTQTLGLGLTSAESVISKISNIRLLKDSSYSNGGYKLSFDGGVNWNGNYGNTNYDHAFMETSSAIAELKKQYKNNYGIDYDQSGRSIYILFMTDGAPSNYDGVYYNYKTDTARPDVNSTWVNANNAEVNYTMGNNEKQYNAGDWYQYIAGGAYNAATKTVPGNPLYWADQVYNTAGVADIYPIGFDLDFGGFSSMTFTENDGRPLGKVLEKLVTGKTLTVAEADEQEELDKIYADLAFDLKLAATNAYYVDEMGDNFNIQLASTVTKFDDTEDELVITLTPRPKITISVADIYTPENAPAPDQIGKPIDGTKKDVEIVVFSDDGQKAYSNKMNVDGDAVTGYTVNADGSYTFDEGDNILNAGVIAAKNFWYNNNRAAVTIDTNGNAAGGEVSLAKETFRWNIGTINNQEFIMSYYVYLDGSAQGEKPAGTYATNNKAVLYYTNWLGNDAEQEVESPALSWESASVYYGFYLVDEHGNPVVKRATGETGPIDKAVQVTTKIFYDEVLLNDISQITDISVASLAVPDGYRVYDNQARYTITIDSNKTVSGWKIVNGKYVEVWDETKQEYVPDISNGTTYATDFRGKEWSNVTSSKNLDTQVGVDYTSTTVWFAVVWEPSTVPDTVVIDYGLPVDISVLENDMFGSAGKLTGIGKLEHKPVTNVNDFTGSHNDDHFTVPAGGFEATYGTAEIVNDKVRYTPRNMQMPGYDKFVYEAQYQHPEEGIQYYYGDVTVIPATTIYYEDSFISYSSDVWSNTANAWVDDTEKNLWTIVQNDDATQEEDRPGEYSLTDANNIYGYDSAYTKMATHSLNGYAKTTVDYDHSAVAEFDFYGTGFDVISVTDDSTGTIIVEAYTYDENGKVSATPVRSFTVDTYYGYTRKFYEVEYTYNAETEEWDVSKQTEITEAAYLAATDDKIPAKPTAGDKRKAYEFKWTPAEADVAPLYQVPVMKMAELPYRKYHVVIRAQYEPFFDHSKYGNDKQYDFYLDAIRIYDPANDGEADNENDTTIEDAYVADSEGWPTYFELRNKILEANSFDQVANDKLNPDMEGLVFIDGDSSVGNAQISDYRNFGPNNEVYLAKNQRVAFKLNLDAYQNAEGESVVDKVHIGIKSADGKTASYTITNISEESGKYYNPRTQTVSTATDMYYDLTPWANDIIVISNYTTDTGTDGIISLTNIKVTFTEKPVERNDEEDDNTSNGDDGTDTGDGNNTGDGPSTASFLYMTPSARTMTLRTLNQAAVEETPEESVPETTIPEESVPETTIPDESEPDTSEPEEPETEVTEPEETEPEDTEPEETKPNKEVEKLQKEFEKALKKAEKEAEKIAKEMQKAAEKAAKQLSKLFGKWF